jgi:hypothetical protein
MQIGLGLSLTNLRGGFNPSALFAFGEQGAWYDPSDITTLFQDNAGTVPVTAAGQSVGLMLDKSGRGNHATQANLAQRPLYQTSPDRLVVDKIDDRLIVTVPTGGFNGTMVLATPEGTAAYGVNIPAGSFDIGGVGGLYFPGTAIVGQIIRNGAMSQAQIDQAIAWLRDKGGGLNYGAVTNFANFWRDQNRLTSFPLINTANGTSFQNAWRDCTSLTTFPLLDVSSGTNFVAAWLGCTSLTSFPLLDVSSGTNFSSAWFACSSLTSFPLLDVSSGTNFQSAWRDCTSLTTFPLLDVSSGTNFNSAWLGCSSLTSFPANMFDTVTGTNFTNAFINTALNQTSIDNILVSINTANTSNGTFNQSGGSAPSVATGRPAIDALRARGWTVTVTGGY